VPEGDYADADYEEGEWVANAETGEMEWHAADGSVMTQDQWNAQAAGDAPVTDAAEAETVEATDAPVEVPATQGAGDNAGE
jgi:N utilization substance protein A